MKTSVDIASKDYSAAEQELLSLEKEYPGDRLVQHHLGLYYETRGKNAEAEKSLTRALELSSGAEEDFEALIGFYLMTKQKDKAIQKINSIPDTDKQAFHYEAMGIVATAAGNPQEAAKDYRKALEKDPKRMLSSQLMFDEYVRENRFDEAEQILDDRIQQNPSDSGAIAERGTLYLKEGDQGDAIRILRKPFSWTQIRTLLPIIWHTYSADAGRDLDDALRYAQGARNRHGDNPTVADTLGWVYYKLGSWAPARDAAEFVVSKQPDNPVYEYHLGAIYMANDQRPEAESALKKALASPQEFKERSNAAALLKGVDPRYGRLFTDPKPGAQTK